MKNMTLYLPGFHLTTLRRKPRSAQQIMANMSRQKQNDLIRLLYASIAGKIAPDRPGRSEPRAVKRRPNPYQLLTAPRHEMKEIKHRSKYRAKKA